ncbi:hypothetical protein [Ornithinimicrobium avium]|uniref:Uncharacterized protein n=1 Tax=Ornithinimicrobium avium TaxID=2283195 RepID=A0A345NLJ2_9MICO|nr:hypothetical protein [Ornithinimicrobium avium]AXH95900.1 hypothetical protein DV701_06950 [Ornithinimicrobium avium]
MSIIPRGRGARTRRHPIPLQGQARAPGDPRGGALLLAALVLVAGGLAFYVGSLRYSVAEAVAVVLLGALVVALVPWVIAATGGSAERAYWVSTTRQEVAPPDALDYRLVRLRRDLRDAVERDDRTDEIYPVLRELAAERLRARHGIDLDAEPERARAAVDAHLWRYLTTPPVDTRKRSRTSLRTAIEGIEKL